MSGGVTTDVLDVAGSPVEKAGQGSLSLALLRPLR